MRPRRSSPSTLTEHGVGNAAPRSPGEKCGLDASSGSSTPPASGLDADPLVHQDGHFRREHLAPFSHLVCVWPPLSAATLLPAEHQRHTAVAQVKGFAVDPVLGFDPVSTGATHGVRCRLFFRRARKSRDVMSKPTKSELANAIVVAITLFCLAAIVALIRRTLRLVMPEDS